MSLCPVMHCVITQCMPIGLLSIQELSLAGPSASVLGSSECKDGLGHYLPSQSRAPACALSRLAQLHIMYTGVPRAPEKSMHVFL